MNTKAASERYQRQVQEISRLPGNDTCADCGGRYPRWASWNLGIFLCVNCAGVHRKMGTHISKIKSLTLDVWTKEQVEKMRAGGNLINNGTYNPDARRNRPPANVDEGERNSELERFIFDKYKGKFMERKPPPLPSKDMRMSSQPSIDITPARSGTSYPRTGSGQGSPNIEEAIPRSRTAPIPTSWTNAKRATVIPPVPVSNQIRSTSGPITAGQQRYDASNASTSSRTLDPPGQVPMRSSSNKAATASAFANAQTSSSPSYSSPTSIAPAPASSQQSSVFDDLLSLDSSMTATTSLQHGGHFAHPHSAGNPWATLGIQQQAMVSPMIMAEASSSMSYFQQPPSGQQQQQTYTTPFNHQQHTYHTDMSAFADRGSQLGNLAFASSNTQPPQMHQNMASSQFPTFSFPHQHQYQSSLPQTHFHPSQQLVNTAETRTPQFGEFAHSMMPLQTQQTTSSSNPWHSNHQSAR